MHVGAAQLFQDLIDSPCGFVIAENRLTERVDQQPDAVTPAAFGVCGKPRVFRSQHDSFGFGENPPADQRHDHLRDQR